MRLWSVQFSSVQFSLAWLGSASNQISKPSVAALRGCSQPASNLSLRLSCWPQNHLFSHLASFSPAPLSIASNHLCGFDLSFGSESSVCVPIIKREPEKKSFHYGLFLGFSSLLFSSPLLESLRISSHLLASLLLLQPLVAVIIINTNEIASYDRDGNAIHQDEHKYMLQLP